MARTPRTFTLRGRAEAKAGKNIGQDKPRKDLTEKSKQTDQQAEISELFTDSESEPACGSA